MKDSIVRMIGRRMAATATAVLLSLLLVGGAYALTGDGTPAADPSATEETTDLTLSADPSSSGDPSPKPPKDGRERIHEGCGAEGLALEGNWTHGDYVSAIAESGAGPAATKAAAQSDCGKPVKKDKCERFTEASRSKSEAKNRAEGKGRSRGRHSTWGQHASWGRTASGSDEGGTHKDSEEADGDGHCADDAVDVKDANDVKDAEDGDTSPVVKDADDGHDWNDDVDGDGSSHDGDGSSHDGDSSSHDGDGSSHDGDGSSYQDTTRR